MPFYNLLGVENRVMLHLNTFTMTQSEKSFMEQSLSKDFQWEEEKLRSSLKA